VSVPPRRPARRAVTASLALTVLLAACGVGTDEPTQPAGAEPGAAAEPDTPEDGAEDGEQAADDGTFPVTLTHRHGETTIDQEPERVVAVGFNDADVVLALGVVPLGERALLGGLDATQRPWFQEALDGAEAPTLLGAEELDFEVIAGLEPDLVLGMYSAMTEEEYATLGEIAPTVAQPDDFIDWGVPWREQLERTGQALGREERAAELLEELEAQFEEARASLPELDGATFTFASASTPELYVYTADDLRARFFADLGLSITDEVGSVTGEEFYAQISREQADLLEADVLVVYAERETFEADPLFAELDVVQEGRVIYLDPADDLTNAVGFSSPLSLPYALDGFLPRLEAALDDDPATVPEPTS
jgi:iron complex transport system substrate-binding protein